MADDKKITETKLRPGSAHFDSAEFSERRVIARPQRGLPYEALFTPQAWSHHAHSQLSPGDEIAVKPEDQSYYALLIVRSKNSNGISVSEIYKKDLSVSAALASDIEEVRIEFGGAHKWRVVRTSDNDVLSKGHPNEQEAFAWAASNRKKAA